MKKTILINNVQTEYYDIDQGKSVTTLILLHSFPANKSLFERYVPILRNNYRMVIPDLPGFGENYKSKALQSIHEYVLWLEAFINRLNLNNPNTLIYAISFSGLIVMNSNNLQNIGKIYIESTPLDRNNIHTMEDEVLNLLSLVPRKILEKAKNSNFLNKYILKLYKIVKPKCRIELSDDVILKYIRAANLDTLFIVNKILNNKESYIAINDLHNYKYTFLYDEQDPTIKYKEIINQDKIDKDRLITTHYGIHAPSTSFTKEILESFSLI